MLNSPALQLDMAEILKIFERDFSPYPPLPVVVKEMEVYDPEKRKVIGDPLPVDPNADKNKNAPKGAKPAGKQNAKEERKIIWEE